ncbi:MAG TPA: DUF4388 domain-containing protein [Myxococcales bacterium]|nr:DUF4388 domain-containing protein [Myxococcales bacterium]
MALSGTLKDFGIADILQLIGHQTKTGRLTLKTGQAEVEVSFKDGTVIFATDKARNSKDLLGSLLLRAELLTQEQLDQALNTQQRTLKRLGDILTESNVVSPAQLSQMMRLQTTETLYKLFSWKNGSYEFSQEEVDPARGAFDPIRAESVLLEGFRRMDEWPALKKKLPWSDATFEKLKELEGPVPHADAALEESHGEDGQPGPRHRFLFSLAAAGRTVEQIADSSRLGEFEAVKALNELVEWSYLKPIPPPRGAGAIAEGLRKGRRKTVSLAAAVVRVALSLAFFIATLFLVRILAPRLGAARPENPAQRGAVARAIAKAQLVRLESALELYRTEHGEYPPALKTLVENELLGDQDLRYPWREPYYYRRTGQGFVLLPPLD